MTDTPELKQNPRFQIFDPNPLLDNRAFILFDPEMSRSVCDLIDGLAEDRALKEGQKHLYAFSKRLRAHYAKQRTMVGERTAGKSFSNKRVDEPIGSA